MYPQRSKDDEQKRRGNREAPHKNVVHVTIKPRICGSVCAKKEALHIMAPQCPIVIVDFIFLCHIIHFPILFHLYISHEHSIYTVIGLDSRQNGIQENVKKHGRHDSFGFFPPKAIISGSKWSKLWYRATKLGPMVKTNVLYIIHTGFCFSNLSTR